MIQLIKLISKRTWTRLVPIHLSQLNTTKLWPFYLTSKKALLHFTESTYTLPLPPTPYHTPYPTPYPTLYLTPYLTLYPTLQKINLFFQSLEGALYLLENIATWEQQLKFNYVEMLDDTTLEDNGVEDGDSIRLTSP